MHELSICEALLKQATRVAAAAGIQCIDRITIAVGPLAGVDPGLLASAFAVMRFGRAARARLIIETLGVQVECQTCGIMSRVAVNRLLCAACGGYRTKVIAGDELSLLRVESGGADPVRVLN